MGQKGANMDELFLKWFEKNKIGTGGNCPRRGCFKAFNGNSPIITIYRDRRLCSKHDVCALAKICQVQAPLMLSL